MAPEPSKKVLNSDVWDTNLWDTQASIYTPLPYTGGGGTTHASLKKQARTTVLKKGAGTVWEDRTLLEWDPKHFRLFIGNLGNDVNDDDLEKFFNDAALGTTSFVKAKVIRDRNTTKTKGFGFVAYAKAEDYMSAWKKMDGKYVGSRPCQLKKAETKVGAVQIGEKKAAKLENDLKERNKKMQRNHRGGGTVAGQAGTSYIRR